jgi:hypothetical protein
MRKINDVQLPAELGQVCMTDLKMNEYWFQDGGPAHSETPKTG